MEQKKESLAPEQIKQLLQNQCLFLDKSLYIAPCSFSTEHKFTTKSVNPILLSANYTFARPNNKTNSAPFECYMMRNGTTRYKLFNLNHPAISLRDIFGNLVFDGITKTGLVYYHNDFNNPYIYIIKDQKTNKVHLDLDLQRMAAYCNEYFNLFIAALAVAPQNSVKFAWIGKITDGSNHIRSLYIGAQNFENKYEYFTNLSLKSDFSAQDIQPKKISWLASNYLLIHLNEYLYITKIGSKTISQQKFPFAITACAVDIVDQKTCYALAQGDLIKFVIGSKQVTENNASISTYKIIAKNFYNPEQKNVDYTLCCKFGYLTLVEKGISHFRVIRFNPHATVITFKDSLYRIN